MTKSFWFLNPNLTNIVSCLNKTKYIGFLNPNHLVSPAKLNQGFMNVTRCYSCRNPIKSKCCFTERVTTRTTEKNRRAFLSEKPFELPGRCLTEGLEGERICFYENLLCIKSYKVSCIMGIVTYT